MSIQDDYFDLRYSLKGDDLRKLGRIWHAFCTTEAEAEEYRVRMVAINAGLSKHAELLAKLNVDTSIK